MSMKLDELFEKVKSLPSDKISTFLDYAETNCFPSGQLEQIYFCLEENLDYSVLINSDLSVYEMEMARLLLRTNHDLECIRCLFTYEKRLRDLVLSFYRMGHDIINLIELEDSNWYLELLIECVQNKISLDCLNNKGLDYSMIYNLSMCLALRYDVESFLSYYEGDFNRIRRKEIVDYFISKDSPSKVFNINRIKNFDEDCITKCTVVAPSMRDAKLISCLFGSMEPFSIECEPVDLENGYYGVIHSS